MRLLDPASPDLPRADDYLHLSRENLWTRASALKPRPSSESKQLPRGLFEDVP